MLPPEPQFCPAPRAEPGGRVADWGPTLAAAAERAATGRYDDRIDSCGDILDEVPPAAESSETSEFRALNPDF